MYDNWGAANASLNKTFSTRHSQLFLLYSSLPKNTPKYFSPDLPHSNLPVPDICWAGVEYGVPFDLRWAVSKTDCFSVEPFIISSV